MRRVCETLHLSGTISIVNRIFESYFRVEYVMYRFRLKIGQMFSVIE